MSSTLAKTLTEKRQNIWNESKGLLDAAAQENRDLTAEEQEKYDRMSSDLSELRQRIDQIAETERNNAAIEEALRNLAPSAEERSGGPVAQGRLPWPAQSAGIFIFAGEVRSVEIDRAPGESFRDLTSAVAGATLVPKTFYGQLVERLIAGSGILAAGATVLETGTGEPMEMPVVTSGVTSALVPEGTAIPKSDPVFGKRTLGAFKYGNLVQASIELVNDSKVDLTSWLADECGRSAGATLGADLINGDGVNPAAPGFGERRVAAYTLVDVLSRVDLGPGALTLGVRNLLNTQYFPVISQLMPVGNASYSAAPGATLSAGYSVAY